MEWTEAHLETLQNAVASGVLKIRHGETERTFRSTAEILQIIAMIEAKVAPKTRRTVARYRSGL